MGINQLSLTVTKYMRQLEMRTDLFCLMDFSLWSLDLVALGQWWCRFSYMAELISLVYCNQEIKREIGRGWVIISTSRACPR